MLFGHNSNVRAGDVTYHVQTEDRGTTNALIDTTVYFRGRVLHRRTNNYFDLLPLNADSEQTLKLRLDEQHRTVVEELRTGTLHLALPHDEQLAGTRGTPSTANTLLLELLNARNWLTGKRATLQVSVRNKENGLGVQHARVSARIDGAAEACAFTSETGSDGRAQLEFEMPRLAGAEPALVIEASLGTATGHLRFQLRSKPRVPAAS
jgi:hypothetical protein